MNSKDKAWLALENLKVAKEQDLQWFEDIEKYIKQLELKTEFAVFDEFDPMQRFYRD